MEGDAAATAVLLQRYRKGDAAAEAQLFERLYAELHRLASHYMRGERVGHLLRPTALINEAYVRLIDQREKEFADRGPFAAIVMRQVLVDGARRAKAAKRNSGITPAALDHSVAVASPDPADASRLEEDVVRLDEALARLRELDERQARIVELRYFAGLSIDETAALLDVSPRTVKRDWTQARAWLYAAMTTSDGPSGEHAAPRA
jgi:RNA polymerase sigma-70 factor (ECF subfamily)